MFDHGGERYVLYAGNGYGRTGFGLCEFSTGHSTLSTRETAPDLGQAAIINSRVTVPESRILQATESWLEGIERHALAVVTEATC